MVRFEAKCPHCGAINKNVYLEETDGMMICESCGSEVKAEDAYPMDWYKVEDGYAGEDDVYLVCNDGNVHTTSGPWKKGEGIKLTITNIDDETDSKTVTGLFWAPIPKCNTYVFHA